MPPPTDPVPMSAPTAKPKRLPNSASSIRLRRRYGNVNLYLTELYLLQVEVISLRETYAKFGYKDIQAIELCRTSRGAGYNWVLGGLAFICAVLALLARNEEAGLYVLGGFAGFFLLLLVINSARGATCACTVQTVTGRQTLRSLARLRPSRLALTQIAERIEAAQGAMDQPTAAGRMEDFLAARAAQQRGRAQNLPVAPPAGQPDAY